MGLCVEVWTITSHCQNTALYTQALSYSHASLQLSLGQKNKTQSVLGLDSSQILLPGSSMLSIKYVGLN